MKSSFRLTVLLLVVGVSPVFAHPFDATQGDLPEVMLLVGDGERTSGVVETYNIPVTDWPDRLQITVVGADGGRGKATTTAGADREGEGGGGASITGIFTVDPDDADSLRPGGELRFILGNKGGSNSRSQVAGGGGGGGTGVIYRAPTEGAEWEILLVAGGGGGGVASTRVADTFGKDGGDANTETFGDDSGLDGGENGGRGGTYSSGAGGGGGVAEGWDNDDPSGGRAAGMTTGSPTGGAGGSPFETGAEGGFGFGGGGAGYSKVNGLTFGAGGGGGGGYSGGGAGDLGKSSNNDKRGGGGGSYIDARASGIVASTRSGNGQEGTAFNVSHFDPVQPEKSLSGPTIVSLDGSSTEVAYTESSGIIVPSASATDRYGNSVSVQSAYPDGFLNRVPGTYTMSFSATDQFGTTSTLEHTLILLDPLPPSFNLAGNVSRVEDSGSYTQTNFARNIDPQNEDVSFLGFTVTNDNNGLFSSQPAISTDGTLTFTPADEAYGSATVSVVGTNDITYTDDVSSDPQTFTITVTRDWTDDPPSDLTLDNQSVPEGTSVIGTITATSFPGDVVTFEIDETEGDAEEIVIDATSGELTFIEIPDYESPNDIGGNNRYRIEVFGTGEEGTVRRTFYIDVTNVNESPEDITLSQNEVEENTTAIGTVTATDPEGSQVFFTLAGGDDASQVSIGYTSGVLTFRTAPDFENPSDANGDNIYEFNIRATDNSRSRIVAVQVIVTDSDESALAVFRTTYGLAGDGSDDNADWSGNGIANLQYFVFGLGDPSESSVDRSLLPTLSIDGNTVTYSYRYAFPTEGFSVRGVSSTDLQSWEGFDSLIGTDEEPVNTDVEADGEGFLRVTTTFPVGSVGRFFAVDMGVF